LAAFKTKTGRNGHVAFEGEGARDHLVIALALAAWAFLCQQWPVPGAGPGDNSVAVAGAPFSLLELFERRAWPEGAPDETPVHVDVAAIHARLWR
jgi:hypothetical protein